MYREVLKSRDRGVRLINSQDRRPPAPKYQDSTMSDKVFKRIIFWFALYVFLVCEGVYFAVGADMAMYTS